MADHPEIEATLDARDGTDGGAAGIARAWLSRQVAGLRRSDTLVRVDAPDAVHQMRVTTRRLRSVLATFRPLLERQATDPLRVELEWLGGLLGEVRDAEVLHQRLLHDLHELPEEEVHGGIRAFVDRELLRVHDHAHQRAVEAMTGDRYLDLLDHLDGLVEDPPWREGATAHGVGTLRRRVRHDWKRVARRVAALDRLQPESYDEGLHDVRKAVRRARYAAEPLKATDGVDAKRFVKAMKRLQSSLGLLQDSVVMRAELGRLADLATSEGVNAFTLGLLQSSADAEIAELRARFPEDWGRASRKRLRRWTAVPG